MQNLVYDPWYIKHINAFYYAVSVMIKKGNSVTNSNAEKACSIFTMWLLAGGIIFLSFLFIINIKKLKIKDLLI